MLIYGIRIIDELTLNMKSGITQKLRQLLDRLGGGKSDVSPEQRQHALDLSLTVMALMAAADGNIDESEILAVQELYSNHGGGIVGHATVRRAFDIVVTDPEFAWRQLRAATMLSSALREDVFVTALQVARADSDIHEDESSLLVQIGTALGLSQNRIDDLCGSDW